jgi:hypothetical protein
MGLQARGERRDDVPQGSSFGTTVELIPRTIRTEKSVVSSGSRARMVIYKNNPRTTHFVEVDLDIYSRSNLQPLVTVLGKKVFVLHAGRDKRTYHAHLELTRVIRSADAAIRGFCALVRALPRAERDLWNTAKVRDFNIGVQAATRPYSYETALAVDTINAASEVRARIVFTVYAPRGRRKRLRH